MVVVVVRGGGGSMWWWYVVVVCSGMWWWYVVVCGGGMQWYVVVVVVCSGMWWQYVVVVCSGMWWWQFDSSISVDYFSLQIQTHYKMNTACLQLAVMSKEMEPSKSDNSSNQSACSVIKTITFSAKSSTNFQPTTCSGAYHFTQFYCYVLCRCV